MSKVTIAAAVLAGLTLSDRLTELGHMGDEVIHKSVGELAGALGELMAIVEKVDIAVGIVSEAILHDEEDVALRGLAAIKGVTEDLVSDQDKLNAALTAGLSDEDKLLMALLAELGNLAKLAR